MPLTMARMGEENYIKKVGGKAETRKFLESLGSLRAALSPLLLQSAGM